MTTTTFVDTPRLTAADRSQSETMRRAARRRRYLEAAGAAVVSIVLLIWTLLPIYNIIMVSFEGHSDVFSGALWPPMASAEGYWVVFTQGYWYLEDFWHQFG